MNEKQIYFKNRKILIYGFGKSGIACFNFLKKNNICTIYDDNKKNIPVKFKKNLINISKLSSINFDFIVLSPGIDIKKCKISSYLRKNRSKIITELDIFAISYPNINKITITGTNGKSTTSKLLYEVLKNSKKDVRLTGNIGYPILLEKKINNKTIFIIEASSYQLDYSKYFRSKYSIILNLTPDHLERHGSFKNYAEAKFKIVKSQSNKDFTFIDNENHFINKLVKNNQIRSKIIKIDHLKYKKYFRQIDNIYFNNSSNKKNLSFVFSIAKVLKLNLKTVINTANKFKGLDYRQQIIYKSKKLIIINDSKSTSFSSTVPLLESYENIYWILGGLAKKGDKLILKKKYVSNIRAYIYGKDRNFLINSLPNKISYKSSSTLKEIMKNLNNNIKNDSTKKVILFSPCAASFDQFKNFEERGKFFNKIIKVTLKKIRL
jgi:UDP-N-acetylmuramoylalanine--D-glutamate ligase